MEAEVEKVDPNGFGFVQLSKEHLSIVEELKNNQRPGINFFQSENKKEPQNKLCFTIVDGANYFCIDTDLMTVSFQNKLLPKIKEIFGL